MTQPLKNRLSHQLDRAISLTKNRSVLFRYSITVLICIVVTLIVLGAQLLIGTTNPYLFILAAVLFAAWFGGPSQGVFTFAYFLLFSWFIFVAPTMHLSGPTFNRLLVQGALYIIESMTIIFLVYRRNKTYEELQVRAAQQAVIAAIGQYGLEENNLPSFMDRVIRAAAQTLHVDYAKVLELLPDLSSFRLRSGIGWKRGLVGKIIIEGGKDSQAGYTILSHKPIVVVDLKKEKRFVGTHVLRDHGIVSGISVVIPGTPHPYGVLSVHTKHKRIFTKDDVSFMRALANVISTTIERRSTRRELELIAALNAELASSLDPHMTVANVVKTLVPNFADICEVYIKKDTNSAELVEVKAISKEKERIFREMGRKYPPSNGSKRPTASVLQSGKPLLISRLPATHAKDVSIDSQQEELTKKLQLISIMVVPIRIRHKIIGTIGFGSFEKGHIYTQRDLYLAKEIADRVAVAVDNATLYQEAKNAIQARDEFLSIASHELKTPLTSMLLQLQTVLRSIKSQSLANFSIEKTMTSLESTITQSKRLSKLVNDLLNISLITTGRLELDREKFDLVKLVSEVIQRIEEPIKKSGSVITLRSHNEIVGNWDKIRLEQVITNLLTNAVKYGEGKPVTIEFETLKNKVIIHFIDHGLGIPQEQQDKIFNRFERGKVKDSIKGLGVGLYLVNEIVLAHGGKITLKSKPKEGSVFSVTLPL